MPKRTAWDPEREKKRREKEEYEKRRRATESESRRARMLDVLKETRREVDRYWYNPPTGLGETWGIVSLLSDYDPTLLDQSNYKSFVEEMASYEKGVDWDEVSPRGAIHLIVRLVDEEGNPTEAGLRAVEILESLDEYPVVNDDDYYKLEYEKALENYQSEARISEEDAARVYTWFSEHDPELAENRDDRGAWADRDEIFEALETMWREDGTYWDRYEKQNIDNILDEFGKDEISKEEAEAALEWLKENKPDALEYVPEDGAYVDRLDVEEALKQIYLAQRREWEREMGQQELF